MPILCGPAQRAGQLALSIGPDVRAADSLGAAARMLGVDPTETLVVIGPELGLDDALHFTSWLRTNHPVVGVVLVRGQVDVGLLTMALQAGVREVVVAGDPAALNAACARSLKVSREVGARTSGVGGTPAAQGRVVTVFAAKGGVGKTTLAVNLGVALAEASDQRVCVVDLDLAFGDVAISVQLDAVRTIVDAVPMTGHVDPTGAASLVTPYRHGLGMLLAPTTPGDAEKVSPELVGELVGALRGIFDYVVVDTPAQFSDHVLAAMDVSTHHVLLTTPDVPALKSLRVTLDMLDLLSYPREIRSVVLNRSDAKVGLTHQDVERVLRCPITAHIPSSRAVPMSINAGTPITLSQAAHPVSQAITGFARQQLLDGSAGRPAKAGRLRRRKRAA